MECQIAVLLIYLLHAFFSFYRLSFLQTEHFMVLFFCLFWYWWTACDSFEIFSLFTLQSKHVQQLIMHNNYLTFAWHIKGLLIFSKHNRYVYAQFIFVYDLTYKLMLFFSMWIRMWLVKGLERCAHFGPLWTFIKKS